MARKFEVDTTRKVVNRVLTWLLRIGRAPDFYYLLTTTGRLSGLPHSVPVVLVKEADQRWLVAPYGVVDWVRNARTAGEVTLSQGASTVRFAIEELPSEQSISILKTYVNQFPITAPYFEVKPDAPATDFLNDAQSKPVFKLINLEGEEDNLKV